MENAAPSPTLKTAISLRQLFADANPEQLTEESICVQGWVRSRRDSKAGLSFLQINDGSCQPTLQIVIPNTLANYTNEVQQLTTGCSVQVTGRLKASPGRGQSVEMEAHTVEVFGWVEDPNTYPMAPKKHSLEHLRDFAHLRPRTNTIGALARIRQTAMQAIHQFFGEQDFYWVPTPLITASDCEGAGELFRVSTLDLLNTPRTPAGEVNYQEDFFGKPTYLTVSGQLNVEAYCSALMRVYTFGPTFRAENSNTARHLAEFWMLEPEIAFADLNDDIQLADEMLKFVFKKILDHRSEEMQFFSERVAPEAQSRLENFVNANLERMTYSEAITRLQASKEKFEFPVEWGCDLQTEHERYLTEKVIQGPLAVMDYPRDIKAFYMYRNDDDKTVASMDILAPGIGEIIGGSQREHRLDVLEQQAKEKSVPLHEELSWYADLRRYGTTPHAGFGLGFERLLAYITGLSNVRDISPFPRLPGHASF